MRVKNSINSSMRTPLISNKKTESNKNTLFTFGNSQNNISNPNTETRVRANNLCSIANISYRKAPRIAKTQFTFGNANQEIAGKIARIIGQHRTPHSKVPCSKLECPDCSTAIQDTILPFIEKDETIQMTLAAFPFKASSKNKCISENPDMAEVISLKFLNSIMTDIKKDYNPAAKLTIFNDGLMFTPIVVNPTDRQTLKYVKNIKGIIHYVGADENIEIKTIADFYPDIRKGREDILDKYPHSISDIKQKALDPNNAEVDIEYYQGSKRFAQEKIAALEDYELEEMIIDRFQHQADDPKGIQYHSYIKTIQMSPDRKLPKNQKDKLAGDIACDSIRRSKAWGMFINTQQPGALRLSCHPQPCGSSKVGIYLTKEHKNWGTPWHLTAVDIGNGEFILAKRAEAEKLGFEMIHPHYKLPDNIPEEEKQKKIAAISTKK